MIKKLISSIAVCAFIVGCTQFLEEDNIAESTYTGDDGCVYCHTNQARLEVLAEEEESGAARGG